MEHILLSWSGGKDSTLSLYEILRNRQYSIAALLTTVTEDYDRVSMHGVRRVLLERQAQALGLPLEMIYLSQHCSNQEYAKKMRDVLTTYKSLGITSVVFGDIFLEDVRAYREEHLAMLTMNAIFPLWGRDTTALAGIFCDLGFRAITTCVDTHWLGREFVGRIIDRPFLAELPETVDPCGEKGEFHSFVFDGPIFQYGIAFSPGEVILRDNRFWYCDLVPGDISPHTVVEQ